MIYLSVEQVCELHRIAAGPAPLIDRATLASAVARPQASFGGVEPFETSVAKAAALLHALASTQSFEDGNKRTAWLAAVVMLRANGVTVRTMADIEAEAFVMAVAVSAWGEQTVAKATEWFTVVSG